MSFGNLKHEREQKCTTMYIMYSITILPPSISLSVSPYSPPLSLSLFLYRHRQVGCSMILVTGVFSTVRSSINWYTTSRLAGAKACQAVGGTFGTTSIMPNQTL